MEDAISCVANGTGRALDSIDLLERSEKTKEHICKLEIRNQELWSKKIKLYIILKQSGFNKLKKLVLKSLIIYYSK